MSVSIVKFCGDVTLLHVAILLCLCAFKARANLYSFFIFTVLFSFNALCQHTWMMCSELNLEVTRGLYLTPDTVYMPFIQTVWFICVCPLPPILKQ